EDEDPNQIEEIRPLAGGRIAAAVKRGEIRGKRYSLSLFQPEGTLPGLLFVGAGQRSSAESIGLLRVAAAASRDLTRRGFRSLAYFQRGSNAEVFAHAVCQGAIEGTYDPGVKKTRGDRQRELDRITLVSSGNRSELEEGARIGQIVGEATTMARNFVNLPPNELTPTSFAERASRYAGECGLNCQILDEQAMKELGMGSLLGVSSGSAQPARLIILRYGNAGAAKKLALVGKGLTFDSGGLSLKTAEGMETMKGDMGGGAAVISAMMAIGRLAPEGIAVTGYVGATENMPSGTSMRPGDVLTAMTGETIEVLNTDAEGRLVLADVLAYAVKDGASHIIDFATLTGGAVVALGHVSTLATGRPSEWVARTVKAAAAGLERAWQMPLYEEYRRAMDSDVADIKNTGGRAGSALTASAFLSDFVGDAQWSHMDIAGTAWEDKAGPYRPTGGTGAGVGTIVALVRDMANQ
ncbi:MAG: leucyl aminopeptidase, partial [Chloroflexota bacterium]